MSTDYKICPLISKDKTEYYARKRTFLFFWVTVTTSTDYGYGSAHYIYREDSQSEMTAKLHELFGTSINIYPNYM
jgi:hypothetical protein